MEPVRRGVSEPPDEAKRIPGPYIATATDNKSTSGATAHLFGEQVLPPLDASEATSTDNKSTPPDRGGLDPELAVNLDRITEAGRQWRERLEQDV